MTGYRGTFVVSWSQTQIDGLTGAPAATIEVGASWRWSGAAVRVDGPDGILELSENDRVADLHAHAARAVRRAVSASGPAARSLEPGALDEPTLDRTFTVTDGRTAFDVTLIDVAELARPLVMMTGVLPPKERDLWIVRGLDDAPVARPITDTPVGVICFTRGTWLRTPQGPRRVEDLGEGDEVDTKDSGPQSIVWKGERNMTGARLYAMPELRPVRIRSGALGYEEPEPDLIVSPRHRVVIKGRPADALFNTSEVLVAAEDLINNRSVARDYTQRSVDYVHLLLPRHHIVWANGVETESFHPASTSFETIDPAQRKRLGRIVPGVEADPLSYGDFARRELTRSEAAILAHDRSGAH